MAKLTVKNPYTGETLKELSYQSASAISNALQSSVEAFEKWRRSSAWERSQVLNAAAQVLESEKTDFAELICQEAGKPIQLARGEVDRAIGVLRWAAAEAQRFSGELLRLDAGATGRPGFGIHTRFPRGVVLGITPFNFPLNLVMHKVAPAIACGCSILIKPSPFTPLTALRVAELFQSLVPGLVQTILADDVATAKLTQTSEVAKISFTGSSAVGWQIRRQAPEKPTTLELGGNAWVIVMEDTPAELYPAIAKRIASGAFGYAGQSCISVQNIAVATSLWQDFEKHLKTATENTTYGDPSLPEVVSGPVIHERAAEKILKQLEKLPSGIEPIKSRKMRGPTSTAKNLITPQMVPIDPSLLPMESPSSSSTSASASALPSLNQLIQEEIFAPIVFAHRFTDLPQLIQRINSSRYGLQAGVYTQHWPTIERLYQDLNVGGLVVNDIPTTRYDHQPYGGVKESGQGREGIQYAMMEMTESKFLALSGCVSV